MATKTGNLVFYSTFMSLTEKPFKEVLLELTNTLILEIENNFTIEKDKKFRVKNKKHLDYLYKPIKKYYSDMQENLREITIDTMGSWGKQIFLVGMDNHITPLHCIHFRSLPTDNVQEFITEFFDAYLKFSERFIKIISKRRR